MPPKTHKPEKVNNPELSLLNTDLAAVVNVRELKAIMNDFSSLTNMVTALLDLRGEVIIATGWQDACTQFHRKHPQTACNCTISDLFLAKNLKAGEYVDYKCKNGLWDVVTPLYIQHTHLGNIYTGQFFYEDDIVDEAFFTQQAEVCGFDQTAYLEAIRRIPRFSRETIHRSMAFLVKLTAYVSKSGLANLQLEKEIVERRRAEKVARESEAYLRTLVRTIPDLVWLKDPQGVYLACNHRFECFFGAKEKDIVGKTDYHFVDKSLADFFRKNDSIAIFKGEPSINEEEVTFAEDGHREKLETIKTPMYRNDGRLVGVLGIGRDITERKQAEQAMQLHELLFKEMGRMAKIGGWEFDPETRQGTWTKEVAHIYDLDPDEKASVALGLSFFHGESHARIEKALTEIIELGRPFDLELELISAKGVHKWVHYKGQPRMKNGNVVQVYGSFQDITDRKKAEAQIHKLNCELENRVRQRTVQLETAIKELEAFSYSVSHDLRAPLRAIDGYSRILMEDYGPHLDENGQRVCQVISTSARQMGKLIDDLLAFSRIGRSALRPSLVDMATLANSIFFELTTTEERERIDFQVDPIPQAMADPTLIRLVWMNLLSNAIKFSANEKRAEIKVKGQQGDSEKEILYSVKDNGAGFNMEYANKLFGVFQRLHSTQEFAGTGVGLAIVQRIIHRHEGRIWACGEANKGAVFHFTLPSRTAAPLNHQSAQLDDDRSVHQ